MLINSKDLSRKLLFNFRLLCSTYIEHLCLKIQKKIETGSIDLEDIYVEMVKGMNLFLIKLIDLALKLSNIIF